MGSAITDSNQIEVDDCNVFVKYLPCEYTENDLYNLFLPHGSIINTKVMVNTKTGSSLGYGFVRFSDPSNAKDAVTKMNRLQIGYKTLLCKLSKPSQTPVINPNNLVEDLEPRDPSPSIYVRVLSPTITDAQLKAAFEPYGDVVESQVLIDQASGKSKRSGYVRFSSIQDATTAIEAMNGTNHLGGSPLIVRYSSSSKSKQQQQQSQVVPPSPSQSPRQTNSPKDQSLVLSSSQLKNSLRDSQQRDSYPPAFSLSQSQLVYEQQQSQQQNQQQQQQQQPTSPHTYTYIYAEQPINHHHQGYHYHHAISPEMSYTPMVSGYHPHPIYAQHGHHMAAVPTSYPSYEYSSSSPPPSPTHYPAAYTTSPPTYYIYSTAPPTQYQVYQPTSSTSPIPSRSTSPDYNNNMKMSSNSNPITNNSTLICTYRYDIEFSELYQQFSRFGSLRSLKINNNSNKLKSYITFSSVENAMHAQMMLDRSRIGGQLIRVKFQSDNSHQLVHSTSF